MRKIIVKAYAKINLALDVLGKRTDGYHEVRMVMQGINLHDKIEMEMLNSPGIQLDCPYPETGPLADNLAFRAAKLLLEKQGLKQGVRIRLRKNIPIAAGLAGGSADGAAVLLGLNTLYGLELGQETLIELAAQLGSDVPFCLRPTTALAQGRGELLTELPGPATLWLVLCKPPYGVSTAQVYQNLHNVRIPKRPDITGLLTAIKENDLPNVYAKMGNVLEYSTFALYPELQEEAERLKNQGVLRVMMTGSGPTLMVFTRDEEEARRAAAKWQQQDWTVIVARSLAAGDLKERVELYE